jgi:hypothetical protein
MRATVIAFGLLGGVACSPAPEPRDEGSPLHLAVGIRPLTPEEPGYAPEEAGPTYLATVRVLGPSTHGADRVELTRRVFAFHAGEEHSVAVGGLKPGQERAEEDAAHAVSPQGAWPLGGALEAQAPLSPRASA